MAVLGYFVLTFIEIIQLYRAESYANPMNYYLLPNLRRDTFDLPDFGLGISSQLFGKVHDLHP